MLKSKIGSVIILYLSFCLSVSANDLINKCEQLATKVKASRCLDQLKNKKDDELKTWLNNQLYILELESKKVGNKSALSMFQRSQHLFTSFREDNCRWKYLLLASKPDAAYQYKKCYIKHTQQRITELSRPVK